MLSITSLPPGYREKVHCKLPGEPCIRNNWLSPHAPTSQRKKTFRTIFKHQLQKHGRRICTFQFQFAGFWKLGMYFMSSALWVQAYVKILSTVEHFVFTLPMRQTYSSCTTSLRRFVGTNQQFIEQQTNCFWEETEDGISYLGKKNSGESLIEVRKTTDFWLIGRGRGGFKEMIQI